eukprot:gnl/MRDRNA2_/MRDRNA2_644639_c0_seq1.p1 gnl/MRDRNA2_/MRDRNA2_644639_c0~~gnl/MRDRNA2_/MRDRNA2_644639_c0_seq1.p1  ORF type:complete len:107 (-),score=16.14 gnl/MRDRNA2_/MRDRNA2_644639_c0_seq1:135-413(-)
MAHANFRNVFLSQNVDDVRWELALLWPEVVSLEDITFSVKVDGDDKIIPKDSPQLKTRNLRQIMDGDVSVWIQGVKIPVLDPMVVVAPKLET